MTTQNNLYPINSFLLWDTSIFLQAFLGDRYGSRLLPTTIPVTEYRSLRRLASWMDESDFAVVDKWYLVNTNAVPAVYQIQPITALCPHFNDPDLKNRIIKQQVWIWFVLL